MAEEKAREREFFLVTGFLNKAPLNEYLWHGYEDRTEFRKALKRTAERWKGRVGEKVGERNGFVRLRFRDAPSRLAEEGWVPLFLTEPAQMPDHVIEAEQELNEFERELDDAFGFG